MNGANVNLPERHRRITPIAVSAGALVWLGALLLYVLTAGPGIVEIFDDSLEFQVVAPTFSIAHPTGYPLYIMAGGLWSRVLFPLGNWAWRMNVFSALAGATAVLLVYLIATRLVPNDEKRVDVWAGLVASAAFALGPVWWSQTTIAEVYALHGLLTAAILYIALTIPAFFAEKHADEGSSAATLRMALLGFLIGLSLAHHRTTVLLLPGLAVYLLWSVPGLWRPRTEWLLWMCAFLLPLALYVWIPLRASQGIVDLNGSYVNSVAGFFDHVLARGYSDFFGENDLSVRHTLGNAVTLIWFQLGATSSVLAIVGLVMMPLREGSTRKVWSMLILVLAANVVFGLGYQVADWEVFFIPVFLTLALFAGAGVSILSGRITGLTDGTRWASVVGATLMALIVAGILVRGAYVNRSDDWDAHQYTHLLGTVAFPPDSCVIGLEGEMTALRYLQVAEGQALNAIPITADQDAKRAVEIDTCVKSRNPTYVTRELPGIETLYSFSGEGPLVRVWPRGDIEAQSLANALDAELMDGRLRLQGYTTRSLALPGGPVLEVTLGWLPVEPLDRDIKISLRLVDASGDPVSDESGAPAVKDEFPLRQVAPSSVWLPGEPLRDLHHIALRGLEGANALQVIVYDAETVGEFGRFELPIH